MRAVFSASHGQSHVANRGQGKKSCEKKFKMIWVPDAIQRFTTKVSWIIRKGISCCSCSFLCLFFKAQKLVATAQYLGNDPAYFTSKVQPASSTQVFYIVYTHFFNNHHFFLDGESLPKNVYAYKRGALIKFLHFLLVFCAWNWISFHFFFYFDFPSGRHLMLIQKRDFESVWAKHHDAYLKNKCTGTCCTDLTGSHLWTVPWA